MHPWCFIGEMHHADVFSSIWTDFDMLNGKWFLERCFRFKSNRLYEPYLSMNSVKLLSSRCHLSKFISFCVLFELTTFHSSLFEDAYAPALLSFTVVRSLLIICCLTVNLHPLSQFQKFPEVLYKFIMRLQIWVMWSVTESFWSAYKSVLYR